MQPKKFFVEETSTLSSGGGETLYLPTKKPITFLTRDPCEEIYALLGTGDFHKYYFDRMGGKGKPRKNVKVASFQLQGGEGITGSYFTSQYTTHNRPLFDELLGPIGGGYPGNKAEFQKIVQSVCPDYSTNPKIIPVGSSKQKVIDEAKKHFGQHGSCVVRIADDAYAPGAGSGVLFMKSENDIEVFINQIDPRSGLGYCDEHGNLLTAVLIEEKFIGVGSPSVTGYIDEQGKISVFSINDQYLNDGQFFAGSNILTFPITDNQRKNMIDKSKDIMQAIAKQYPRSSLLGFDLLMLEDGSFKFIECNFRETGNTIPFITSHRATNYKYINNPEQLGRYYCIDLHRSSPFIDIPKILDQRSMNNKKNIHAVISYGNQGDETHGMFDLVIYYDRKTMDDTRAKRAINDLLKDLGHNTSL